MDSYSTRICRLCLESSDDVVNIFGSYQNTTVALVLTQHFWFQVSKDDGFTEYLCQICWINVKTFHTFYKRVERRQKDNSHLASVRTHLCKQEPCDSPTLKPNLNLVESEIMDPLSAPVILFQISKEESSKFLYLGENVQTVGSDDRIQKETDVGENTSTASDVDCNKTNEEEQSDKSNNCKLRGISLSEKNAKVREFFSMTCRICSEPFETFAKCEKHYRTVHNVPGYVYCCGRKFHTLSLALNHIFFHLNPNAFRCDTCDKRFFDKVQLKCHIENHEPVSSRAFKCDLCPLSFNSDFKFRSHRNIAHCPVKCDMCDMSFQSKLKLAIHVRSVHRVHQSKVEISAVCDICGIKFCNKSSLLNHMRGQHSKSENAKLQCDICKAWFKNKRSLELHMNRHLKCTAKCSLCSKVFQNESSLGSHMRFVHREKRHRCSICDKRFRTHTNLKEHMAGHTGQTLYECEYCTKTFNSSANKYSHRKKMHLAEWTKDNPKRRPILKKISLT